MCGRDLAEWGVLYGIYDRGWRTQFSRGVGDGTSEPETWIVLSKYELLRAVEML